MRMLVGNADDQTAADPSLLRIIARAHDIQGRLSQNTKLTVHDIAREEGVTAAYIYILLRFPWLAPDITTAIVNGRQPQQLNAKSLVRKAGRPNFGRRTGWTSMDLLQKVAILVLLSVLLVDLSLAQPRVECGRLTGGVASGFAPAAQKGDTNDAAIDACRAALKASPNDPRLDVPVGPVFVGRQ